MKPKITPPTIGPASVPLPPGHHHDDHRDGVDEQEHVGVDDLHIVRVQAPAAPAMAAETTAASTR